MGIFYPKCRQKNPLKECHLNSAEICALCEKRHATKYCPLFLGLREVYDENVGIDPTYFVSSKQPWQPRTQGMTQDPMHFFNNYAHNSNNQFPYPNQWYPPPPWVQ